MSFPLFSKHLVFSFHTKIALRTADVHQFWTCLLTRVITGRSLHVQNGYPNTSKWRLRIKDCTVISRLFSVLTCQSGTPIEK
ncbi:hypothetical protein CEXT_508911 [Caerostris extrusa]|uniref:Uncharacterized protein n=1 Tax=Caerostris extrusa TaxID=172846 RepID=A0AAV4M9D3_CAEEX|nr:hypothetical protein CEXT_508911 [Caerostris extrusa]